MNEYALVRLWQAAIRVDDFYKWETLSTLLHGFYLLTLAGPGIAEDAEMLSEIAMLRGDLEWFGLASHG